MVDVGISDDYAVLDGEDFSFYYGYEETDKNGDWLFVATVSGKTKKYHPTEIEAEHGDNPEEVLLKGIGKFLEDV